MKEQVDAIWNRQFEDRREQFVYQTFGGVHTATEHRQLRLVLAISKAAGAVPRRDVATLSPALARAYAGKPAKTVIRDLNAVTKLGLVHREPDGFAAADEQIGGLAGVVRGVPADGS